MSASFLISFKQKACKQIFTERPITVTWLMAYQYRDEEMVEEQLVLELVPLGLVDLLLLQTVALYGV